MFFIFFVGLVIYLQRENMREGYPLVDEDGTPRRRGRCLAAALRTRSSSLPHGRGEMAVPSGQNIDRTDLGHWPATNAAGGFPFDPTGDPMVDGVGPGILGAAATMCPSSTGTGHPEDRSDVGDRAASTFRGGSDPRGMPVVSGDDVIVGMIIDMWIDEPEQLVRYLEISLEPEHRRRQAARADDDGADLSEPGPGHARSTANISQACRRPRRRREVTKLEEDKIMAYYGGGLLYADATREAPQI